MIEKYGNIAQLIKDSKNDPENEADKLPKQKVSQKTAGQSNKATKVPAIELTEIVKNQFVKKTFDINLVHEIAIETLKSDRKKKTRFNKSEKTPLTNNGIMDEIIGTFFQLPENAKYLQAALEELSGH